MPAREGHRRLYSLDDLAEIAVICELRQRAFSLQRVRKVLRFLQAELGKRLVETVTESSEYHLLTDGKNIYLEDSAQGVVNVLKNSRQPMFAICLSDTVTRIQAEVHAIPGPRAVSSVALAAYAVAGAKTSSQTIGRSTGTLAPNRRRKTAS